MGLVVINANENHSIIPQQFLQELQPRVHHAAPLVVAAEILGLPADGLIDPLLELRLGQILVKDPTLIAGVVRWVDVNALDSTGVGWKKGLESEQVVAFDNQVAVETWLLTLGQNGQLGVELEDVMGDGVVVRLNPSFP